MYDLEADRGETNNVSKENVAIVNDLSAKYFDWANKTGVVEYSKIRPGNELIPGAAAKK